MKSNSLSITLLVVLNLLLFSCDENEPIAGLQQDQTSIQPTPISEFWQPFDVFNISDEQKSKEVLYGRDLIIYTAYYFGPKGRIAQQTNGLNCQNCHLDAGTKPFGNNYGSVASTYPKVRARSGKMESIEKRINDCFERSLNGKPLKENSKEMRAMVAYMKFLGENVKKGEKASGSGLKELPFLNRAADPQKGKSVYELRCASCHQANGQGIIDGIGQSYVYPPLWGPHSFNDAAGLSRISNMAKYVKYNMPLGVNHDAPELTDEDAWDVAAYIESMPRPHKPVPQDWPNIAKKPIDHPFGPYADNFSEQQHKYGPFTAMKKDKK
ncbi:MAG: c-type cytochrome [Flavobacteriales bacterium]